MGVPRCPQPSDLTFALSLDPAVGSHDVADPYSGSLTDHGCGIALKIPGNPVTIDVFARTPGTQATVSPDTIAKAIADTKGIFTSSPATQAAAPDFGNKATLVKSQLAMANKESQPFGSPYDFLGLATVDGSGNWLYVEITEEDKFNDTAVWPATSVPTVTALLRTWLQLIYPGA